VASLVKHFLSEQERLGCCFSQISTEELLSAAVLHDVVEDCNIELKTIEKECNSCISALVGELTSDAEQIKTLGKTQYLTDKMMNMSREALLIKLCDRLDNVSDLHNLTPEKQLSYCESTLSILNNLKGRASLDQIHLDVIKQIQNQVLNLIQTLTKTS
jgi:(p)ppGpp synthase/HD superfamily hydrolase